MRMIWTLIGVICICSLAFGHGNSPKLNVAGVEFPIDLELAVFLSTTGLTETGMSGECAGDAFQTCAEEREGVWSNNMSWCIEMYLCAYYICRSECSGAMRSICIETAQWELYNCSGIDLMSAGAEWGTDHDETVEILQELYD